MKRLLVCCLPGLVLVAAGSVTTPVWADPPLVLEGAGQRLTLAVVPPVTEAENSTRFGLSTTADLSGGLDSSAPFVGAYTCKTVTQSGRTKCEGEETFTGTVAGVGEGITVARVTVSCEASDACVIRSHIEGVSGDLEDVRGTAIGQVTADGAITYTVRLTQT